MKNKYFIILGLFLTTISIIFLSWDKNPEERLADKIIKSENYKLMSKTYDRMAAEIRKNALIHRTELGKNSRNIRYLLSDKSIGSEQKTALFEKMGMVQSPEFIKALNENNLYHKKLFEEFPDLKLLTPESRSRVFHIANTKGWSPKL